MCPTRLGAGQVRARRAPGDPEDGTARIGIPIGSAQPDEGRHQIHGLPGVCLDGPEAHAHADVAFFRRLGLPDELAAATIEEYVAKAARLINDPAWLAKCSKAASQSDLDVLFQGDETEFCKAIYALVAK